MEKRRVRNKDTMRDKILIHTESLHSDDNSDSKKSNLKKSNTFSDNFDDSQSANQLSGFESVIINRKRLYYKKIKKRSRERRERELSRRRIEVMMKFILYILSNFINILAVLTYILATIFDNNKDSVSIKWSAILQTIDVIFSFYFVFEYILILTRSTKGILKHVFSWDSLIDSITIGPSIITYFVKIVNLNFLRIFRIFRVFRILRIYKSLKMIQQETQNSNEEDEDGFHMRFDPIKLQFFTIVVVLIGVFFIGAGLVLGLQEIISTAWSRHNLNFIDAIYFMIVTYCTLGYGDITPTHTASRLFVIVGLFTLIIIISDQLSKLAQLLTVWGPGWRIFTKKSHFIVILDTSLNLEVFLQAIRRKYIKTHIILISKDNIKFPSKEFPYNKVYLINTVSFDFETFERANTRQAKAIFIFCNKSVMECDQKEKVTDFLILKLNRFYCDIPVYVQTLYSEKSFNANNTNFVKNGKKASNNDLVNKDNGSRKNILKRKTLSIKNNRLLKLKKIIPILRIKSLIIAKSIFNPGFATFTQNLMFNDYEMPDDLAVYSNVIINYLQGCVNTLQVKPLPAYFEGKKFFDVCHMVYFRSIREFFTKVTTIGDGTQPVMLIGLVDRDNPIKEETLFFPYDMKVKPDMEGIFISCDDGYRLDAILKLFAGDKQEEVIITKHENENKQNESQEEGDDELNSSERRTSLSNVRRQYNERSKLNPVLERKTLNLNKIKEEDNDNEDNEGHKAYKGHEAHETNISSDLKINNENKETDTNLIVQKKMSYLNLNCKEDIKTDNNIDNNFNLDEFNSPIKTPPKSPINKKTIVASKSVFAFKKSQTLTISNSPMKADLNRNKTIKNYNKTLIEEEFNEKDIGRSPNKKPSIDYKIHLFGGKSSKNMRTNQNMLMLNLAEEPNNIATYEALHNFANKRYGSFKEEISHNKRLQLDNLIQNRIFDLAKINIGEFISNHIVVIGYQDNLGILIKCLINHFPNKGISIVTNYQSDEHRILKLLKQYENVLYLKGETENPLHLLNAGLNTAFMCLFLCESVHEKTNEDMGKILAFRSIDYFFNTDMILELWSHMSTRLLGYQPLEKDSKIIKNEFMHPVFMAGRLLYLSHLDKLLAKSFINEKVVDAWTNLISIGFTRCTYQSANNPDSNSRDGDSFPRHDKVEDSNMRSVILTVDIPKEYVNTEYHTLFNDMLLMENPALIMGLLIENPLDYLSIKSQGRVLKLSRKQTESLKITTSYKKKLVNLDQMDKIGQSYKDNLKIIRDISYNDRVILDYVDINRSHLPIFITNPYPGFILNERTKMMVIYNFDGSKLLPTANKIKLNKSSLIDTLRKQSTFDNIVEMVKIKINKSQDKFFGMYDALKNKIKHKYKNILKSVEKQRLNNFNEIVKEDFGDY